MNMQVEMAKTLTKSEMMNHLMDNLGLTRQQSRAFVETFFRELSDSLIAGQQVKLSGFGNFDIKDTDPVMNYLDRQDTEFQMVFVKSMIKRCPQIITHKRLQPWTGKIANMMRGV